MCEIRKHHSQVGAPISPFLISTALLRGKEGGGGVNRPERTQQTQNYRGDSTHRGCSRHPPRHELVDCLQRVVDGKAVGKPGRQEEAGEMRATAGSVKGGDRPVS